MVGRRQGAGVRLNPHRRSPPGKRIVARREKKATLAEGFLGNDETAQETFGANDLAPPVGRRDRFVPSPIRSEILLASPSHLC